MELFFLFLLIFLMAFALASGYPLAFALPGSAIISILLAGLAGIALVIPGLAMVWRRLHDVDKSGAWFFIIFTCVGAIVLLVWYVTKGSAGPNRFGPDPLGSGEALPEPPTSDDGPTLEA